jgi:hypothetical protein
MECDISYLVRQVVVDSLGNSEQKNYKPIKFKMYHKISQLALLLKYVGLAATNFFQRPFEFFSN